MSNFQMVLGVLGLCFFTQVIALQVFLSSLILVRTLTYLYSTNHVSSVSLKRDRICCSQVWGTGRKEGTHALVSTRDKESIRVEPKTDV